MIAIDSVTDKIEEIIANSGLRSSGGSLTCGEFLKLVNDFLEVLENTTVAATDIMGIATEIVSATVMPCSSDSIEVLTEVQETLEVEKEELEGKMEELIEKLEILMENITIPTIASTLETAMKVSSRFYPGRSTTASYSITKAITTTPEEVKMETAMRVSKNFFPRSTTITGMQSASTPPKSSKQSTIEEVTTKLTTVKETSAGRATTTKLTSNGVTTQQSTNSVTTRQTSNGVTSQQTSNGVTSQQTSNGITTQQTSNGVTSQQTSNGVTTQQTTSNQQTFSSIKTKTSMAGSTKNPSSPLTSRGTSTSLPSTQGERLETAVRVSKKFYLKSTPEAPIKGNNASITLGHNVHLFSGSTTSTVLETATRVSPGFLSTLQHTRRSEGMRLSIKNLLSIYIYNNVILT